ncbi:hypothetical protein EJ02DRAFT_453336 [Clathrospora elynae]|uniref:Uncharacterized protein n=1 Tax=Clathrospora elynae TaxID=706981 RepID=A0A6A5STF5_9PLEO|nr:hypothetical protein EJ02DRAFT_453336 [Clathrospora elynae]
MAPLLCPWAWSDNLGLHGSGHHGHFYRNPYTSRRMRAPRWAFPELAPGPCCEFCTASENIPSLNMELNEIAMFFPPFAGWIGELLEDYVGIHHHYQQGFDHDGRGSFFLAREIDRFSKSVRQLYCMFPDMHGLATWSDQLKYMGRNTQMEPRRRRYSTMPKDRYNRWLLFPLRK